jgi:hypothetical protein
MYTATMQYHFTAESFDQACTQKGFVRMQFLTTRPKALAIGTWDFLRLFTS